MLICAYYSSHRFPGPNLSRLTSEFSNRLPLSGGRSIQRSRERNHPAHSRPAVGMTVTDELSFEEWCGLAGHIGQVARSVSFIRRAPIFLGGTTWPPVGADFRIPAVLYGPSTCQGAESGDRGQHA